MEVNGYKSKAVSSLIISTKFKSDDKTKSVMPKGNNSIRLSDLIKNLSFEDSVESIIEDINNHGITIEIDSEGLKILDKIEKDDTDKKQDDTNSNKELKEKVHSILSGTQQKMNIDVSSISELSSERLANLTSNYKIGRIYVNSGYDEAAKKGYSVNEYAQIRFNANKILEKVFGENASKMSSQEKFEKLYKFVVDRTKFDYNGVGKKCVNSRNLLGFFTQQKAVCAGVAVGLKNLCDCVGIECEYVQGWGCPDKKTSEYHAWIRVKIDGKWYNCDPTWDMGKVGQTPFYYFMKSDAEFNRSGQHQIDTEYNPTYVRRNGQEFHSYNGPRRYEKSTTSLNGAMDKYVDNAYLVKYGLGRASSSLFGKDISKEVLDKLAMSRIPVYGTRVGSSRLRLGLNSAHQGLSFKQKIANFLYTGSFFKKLPIIRDFVERNTTLNTKKVLAKPEKAQGMYRTDGKLSEAIDHSKVSRTAEQKRETMSREEKQR